MEKRVSNWIPSLDSKHYIFCEYSEFHFKKVKISATALIKMVMHTKSGGDIEVMGMMQGKV